ncbi:Putative asparagine synthetase [glutamine-hydrolyzing] [Pandoraea pulmonicola]|nr:Putative asparagine synthetase [glutamine-hydrolyzing] [Pandoraea pulmonicola]
MTGAGDGDEMKNWLGAMTDAILHRGPDAAGAWVDRDAGIALGHRRLAIVDLTEAGAQPMTSPSGRFVMIYNGEVYNHLAMRAELERVGAVSQWRGHSDSETFVAGFDVWGIEATLQRAVGMFALAIWDRERRELTLARDRLGEKPLYYGWQGAGNRSAFLFGSELVSLRRHPAFLAEVDRNALATYMRYNCIGSVHSIYQGIQKLAPGHLATLSAQRPTPDVKAWWSGIEAAVRGVANPFKGSAEEAVDALEALLKNAVTQQMMADVPLGAFLSGGIDSSTVVALMQAQSSRPVKTFTIGFHDKGYNEAEHAKAVARHLGTEHTELYVSPEQVLDVVPRLPQIYSEPFADSSQIPTVLISQLARQHVTVSLSGDAGDELFCGYRRYRMTAALWGKLSRVPLPLRRLAAGVITSVSPQMLDRWGALLGIARAGDKLHKGAGLLGNQTVAELYRGMVSHWDEPERVVLGAAEPIGAFANHECGTAGLNDVERMMALDMVTYLPDDVLAKVDRAAMSMSLETRVPFLDHRVVEFAWTLPLEYKLRNGVTKWPLREILYRHVPRELIERPKMGFGVPLERWLCGPLREWAETLLSTSRLRSEGFFDAAPIRRLWEEHLSGKRNWQYLLWDVLMFQAWLEQTRSE